MDDVIDQLGNGIPGMVYLDRRTTRHCSKSTAAASPSDPHIATPMRDSASLSRNPVERLEAASKINTANNNIAVDIPHDSNRC